jgi:hypothetical protein
VILYSFLSPKKRPLPVETCQDCAGNSLRPGMGARAALAVAQQRFLPCEQE